MTTFGVVAVKTLQVLGLWPDYSEDWDEDRKALVRLEYGVPVEIYGVDGGEPEDQTLGRNWSWLPEALQAVYNLGYENGCDYYRDNVEAL